MKTKPKSASKAKSAPAKRAQSKSSTDAITLLKTDHKEATAMFRQYEAGKDKLSDARKTKIAGDICNALTVHMKIEEELFYPAVAEEVDGAEDLLAEAKVEHNSCKRLIDDVTGGSPGSDEYDANVKVLGEYISHHVDEEETELFPKVRKSGMDLKSLGAEMLARKNDLTGRGAKNDKADMIFGGALAG